MTLPEGLDPAPLLVLAGLVEANAILVYSRIIEYIACKFEGMGRTGAPLLILASGLIASALLNDAVVLQATPVIWNLLKGEGKGELQLALLLAAVNIGSALGPYGNPQDVLILHYYHLGIIEYSKFTVPVYLPILASLTIASYIASRDSVPSPGSCPSYDLGKALLGIALAALTVAGGFSGIVWLGPLAGSLAVVLLRLTRRVDWATIVIVGGAYAISRIVLASFGVPLPRGVWDTFAVGFMLSLAASNVPATAALLGAPWRPLHLAVNLAGTVHVYSSMANLIGLRAAGASWRRMAGKMLAVSAPMLAYGVVIAWLLAG